MDISATAQLLFDDLFVYFALFQVLICIKCQRAIIPQWFKSHLRDNHSLPCHLQKQLCQILSSLFIPLSAVVDAADPRQILRWTPEDCGAVVFSLDPITPIAFLQVKLNGLRYGPLIITLSQLIMQMPIVRLYHLQPKLYATPPQTGS